MISALWIEEEADSILSDTRTYLQNNSYHLDIVYNASDAEEKLTTNSYDLIILDIQILAGMDNYWIDLHMKEEKLFGLVLLEKTIAANKNLLDKTIIFTNEDWADIEARLIKCKFPKSRFLQKRFATEQHQLDLFIKKTTLSSGTY